MSQKHPTCHNTSQQGGQTCATYCTQQCCESSRMKPFMVMAISSPTHHCVYFYCTVNLSHPKAIGPLQDPVTWYGINYVGTQMTHKGKSGWTGTSSFVLEVSLRHLRPSIIYSVPCDRILQRAYFTSIRAVFASL